MIAIMRSVANVFRIAGGGRPRIGAVALVLVGALLGTAPALRAQTLPLTVRGHNLYAGARPAYLFGQGFWHAVVKGGFDMGAEADWYRPYGVNLTRVKTITSRIVPSTSTTPENPWVRLATGKYDLDRFNETFWKRLDAFLQNNAETGRYVLLQIFDEVITKEGDDAWDRHPLNPDNHINGLTLPRTGQRGTPDIYDLRNTRLLDYYQRYLGRLLESTYQYRHVIYEISNEYTGTKEFLDWVLARIRAFEKARQVDLLVTNMSCTPTLFNHEASAPDIDLLDFWHAPRSIRTLRIDEIYANVTSLRASVSKPLLTGRIGLEPDRNDATPNYRRVARAQLWAILMAGGVAATTKEDYAGIENGPPAYNLDAKWETQGFLGLHLLLHNLWQTGVFQARNDIILSRPFTDVWAAAVGHEWVVYMVDVAGPGGGTLRLRNLPTGRYTAKLYDPGLGQVLRVDRLGVVDGTASIEVDPVSLGDRVVWLTPEPFDVAARWEEQGGRRRCLIELRDFASSGVFHAIFLNGKDVSTVILPLFRPTAALPGGGLQFATPWMPLPGGVYELVVWVQGSLGTDRSILRMQVD
ncbi:MAG: hypothetical protein JXQ29_18335 [Planctomycetes bacterium]|nr:hypothetical protein [Planctomycetota bacterium]